MYDTSVESNQDYIAIVKPEVLCEEHRTRDNQLVLLLSGFGCKPMTSGNACYVKFCANGHRTRIERYDLLGIADEETETYAYKLMNPFTEEEAKFLIPIIEKEYKMFEELSQYFKDDASSSLKDRWHTILAKLPEEEATAFIQENRIEDMSVKEVKRTLATYQDKKEEDPTAPEEPILEIVRESIPVDSFGAFIKSKRLDKGYSKKETAKRIGIPVSTYSDAETGHRSLVGKNQSFYNSLIQVLKLSKEEIKELYSWADKECSKRKKLANDLVEYAVDNPIVSQILRVAKDNHFSTDKLEKILKQLQAV